MAESEVEPVPKLNFQGLEDKEQEGHEGPLYESAKSKNSSLKYGKQRAETSAGTLDSTSSLSRQATPRQKKIGHRRVDKLGETTYKKTTSSALMNAIQLGIGHSIGSLSAKPERDLLLQDFPVVESITFPAEGSNITPAHPYPDFRFKTYSPIAFRYFRDLFGIQPDDFLVSLVDKPLVELSNPGASGSVFYLTDDDEFIIKTVQHKEADFLQKLLPGYYMNLNQNPRTLLPKFYGLYTYQSGGRNIRCVAMNNLMPSHVTMHNKYDLKGSTFKRKASKSERQKKLPTFKDLDFMQQFKEGIFLDGPTYNALMKTIQRDCRVLESFKIMDYSLLLTIHNIDLAEKEKQEKRNARSASTPGQTEEQVSSSTSPPKATHSPRRTKSEMRPPVTPSDAGSSAGEDAKAATGKRKPVIRLERSKSYLNRQRVAAFSTTREAIQGSVDTLHRDNEEEDEEATGGIPAKNSKGERLLLFIGLIDILQCYKLKKKLEHSWKALVHDGDTVSVTRPSYYAARFQDFMTKHVFKKMPLAKHSPSKRRGFGAFGGGLSASGGRPRARTAPDLDNEGGVTGDGNTLVVGQPASHIAGTAQDVIRERTNRDRKHHTISNQPDRGGDGLKSKYSVPPKSWTLPPTYEEFVKQSGGAKPKTPRPDLVPSTPPRDDEELARPLDSDSDPENQPGSSGAPQHSSSVKFTTPPPTRSVNVSEIAIQTTDNATASGGKSEPFRMEDLERKLSEVDESVLNSAARPEINTMFPTTPTQTPTTSPGTMTPPSMSTPHTYSGSSTIDTASESSPRKLADISQDSMESPTKILSSPVEETAETSLAMNTNAVTADDGDVNTSALKGDAGVAIVNGDGDGIEGKSIAAVAEADNAVAETENTTVGNDNQNNDTEESWL